jgi:hypothetical protein
MSNVDMPLSTKPRTPAGFNETRVRALLSGKAPDILFLGKRRFSQGNVEISVDDSFTHDGTNYLLEVDSGNMAKLLVGQYVLLNQLSNHLEFPSRFLVVHTYKAYNPSRTLENLRLVNQQLYAGNGLPFGAIHFSTLEACSSGIQNVLQLFAHASSRNSFHVTGVE